MSTRTANAAAKAIAGATRAGMTTSCTRPCHCTPAVPACASAAPTRPPMSACDELDGRPSRQVRRFHVIAPTSAARTVVVSTRPVSTIPLPTVFATAAVTKAPARLATAATATAMRGDTARVDTDVETTFAVSWKPFVKSKPSATTTVMTRRTTPGTVALAVLDESRLEDVCRVLERVHGLLEPLV